MNKNLKILLASFSLITLAGGLFGPLYAVFVEKIGGGLISAGGAYSFFSISAGILIFLMGKWEDRVKHQEKLVLFGYLLNSLGFLGYMFINRPIELFAVQIILGIGEAIWTPAFDSLYTKSLDKGKFASEWGMWDSLHFIITGISAMIGGFIATILGFKFLFLIMFLLSISGTIIVSLLLLSERSRP
ncbi:MAG: MFS transporter [Candidatus Aenigmarchaeota archaeon]|nr:MFS transporter [Candidatus Aenigmarchaeota archaeon]